MPLLTGIQIAIIAFFAEYIDSSIGMGYGTILTPLLLLMGFSPLEVVPAVLLSEFATGILAGFTHHRAGNVDFKPKVLNIAFLGRRIKEIGCCKSFSEGCSIHLKIALLLGICSVVGTISAVFISVKLPKACLTMAIGCIIFVIGIVILATLNKNYGFSWRKIIFLGLTASFNKGLSGGGYGPLVTGGQLLSGVETKSTIGITSLAEGLTCMVGFITYLVVVPHLDLKIAPYNITGAILAVPLAAISVKIINENKMRLVIGILTAILGILTITKTLNP
jgi:uncharacterized membrane protein YfcA